LFLSRFGAMIVLLGLTSRTLAQDVTEADVFGDLDTPSVELTLPDESETQPLESAPRPPARRTQTRMTREEMDTEEGRLIELRSAIEEALRKNPFEQIRGNVNAILDLNKKDNFDGFWLPQVSLDINSSNQRFDRIYTSQSTAPGLESQVSPTGSFGISIKEYTIFNWGRDYLAYQNVKNSIQRENQRLVEARRKLRFQVITQFFSLIRAKEIVKIKREQLRQSSFIHRLAREKLQLRKIPAMEYYQTRSEFLRAQTEYQQSLFDVGHEEERLSNLLGDEYRSNYKTTQQLKFTTLGTTIEEAMRQAYQTSPQYRDSKLQYENAQRLYEKVIKDNLPLPKFSLGMGTYQQQFAPAGNAWLRDTGTGRNVEMVAAINMSWTLIGEKGLFNSRENKRAYLDKRIAEIQFYNSKREIDVRVRTLLRTIKFLEQKVTIADYQDKNARSNFDSTLNNYTTGRTTFPQIKLSLDNWVLSLINREDVKLDHLKKKLELAELMGLDDLPGDNFDTLAVR
jgi:outer membrane protein TolC